MFNLSKYTGERETFFSLSLLKVYAQIPSESSPDLNQFKF